MLPRQLLVSWQENYSNMLIFKAFVFVSTEDYLLHYRGTHPVKEDLLKLNLLPKVSFIYSLICFEPQRQ